MNKKLVLAAGALIFAGCSQDYKFATNSVASINPTQDIQLPVISTLLVVDNSESMADEQDALASAFAKGLDNIRALDPMPNVDFYLYSTTSLDNDSGFASAAVQASSIYSWRVPFAAADSTGPIAPALQIPYSLLNGYQIQDPSTISKKVVSLKTGMSDADFLAAKRELLTSITQLGIKGSNTESAFCTMGRFLLEKERFGIQKGTPFATIVLSDADEATTLDQAMLQKCTKETSRTDFDYVAKPNGSTSSDVATSGSGAPSYYKYSADLNRNQVAVTFTQNFPDRFSIRKTYLSGKRFQVDYKYIPVTFNASYKDTRIKYYVDYLADWCKSDGLHACTASERKSLEITDLTAYKSLNTSLKTCSNEVKTWLEKTRADLQPQLSKDPTIQAGAANCVITWSADDQAKNINVSAPSGDVTAFSGTCPGYVTTAINSKITADNQAKGSTSVDIRSLVSGSCSASRQVVPGSTGVRDDFSNYKLETYSTGYADNYTNNCQTTPDTRGAISGAIGSNNVLLAGNNCTFTILAGQTLTASSPDYLASSYGINANSTCDKNNFASGSAPRTWLDTTTGTYQSCTINWKAATTTTTTQRPTINPVPTSGGTCASNLAVNSYVGTQKDALASIGSCSFVLENVAYTGCRNVQDTDANVGFNNCDPSRKAQMLALCTNDPVWTSISNCTQTGWKHTSVSGGTTDTYPVIATSAKKPVHLALSASATTLAEGIKAKIIEDQGPKHFFFGAIVNNKGNSATCTYGPDKKVQITEELSTAYMKLADDLGNFGYVQSLNCTDDYSPAMVKLEDFVIKNMIPSYSFKAKTEDVVGGVDLKRNGTLIPIVENVDYILTKTPLSSAIVSYKIQFLPHGDDDTTVLQKGDEINVRFSATYTGK